jgi:hypothetical protein
MAIYTLYVATIQQAYGVYISQLPDFIFSIMIILVAAKKEAA